MAVTNPWLPSQVPSRALFSAERGLATYSTRGIPKHKVYPQWQPSAPQHGLWQPASWLGAYYKLREHDATAMRNRERLRGKRHPTRGRFIVGAIERMERDKLEAADPWRKGVWRVGDYLEVEHCAKVGEAPDRIVGILIGVHRRGIGSSFRLLSYVDSTAVEYQFQLYSPLVRSVIVRKDSDWRDGKRKLFGLRQTVSKLNFPAATKIQKKVVEQAGPSLSHRKKQG